MTTPRQGLTLLELVVVLAVLVGISSILVPLFGGTIQTAQEASTRRTLLVTRDALYDYWYDTRLVVMDGISTVALESDRLELDWLFYSPISGDTTLAFNASTRIGWRGPYVAGATGDFVAAGFPFLIDAWNREIVVQDVNAGLRPRDVRIVSAGPNGVLETPAGIASSDLTTNDVGDDVYVAFMLY